MPHDGVVDVGDPEDYEVEPFDVGGDGMYALSSVAKPSDTHDGLSVNEWTEQCALLSPTEELTRTIMPDELHK